MFFNRATNYKIDHNAAAEEFRALLSLMSAEERAEYRRRVAEDCFDGRVYASLLDEDEREGRCAPSCGCAYGTFALIKGATLFEGERFLGFDNWLDNLRELGVNAPLQIGGETPLEQMAALIPMGEYEPQKAQAAAWFLEQIDAYER